MMIKRLKSITVFWKGWYREILRSFNTDDVAVHHIVILSGYGD